MLLSRTGSNYDVTGQVAVGAVTRQTNISHNAISHILGKHPRIGPRVTRHILHAVHRLNCTPPHTRRTSTLKLDESTTRLPPYHLNILLADRDNCLQRRLLHNIQSTRSFLHSFGVRFLIRGYRARLPRRTIRQLRMLTKRNIGNVTIYTGSRTTVIRGVGRLHRGKIIFIAVGASLANYSQLYFVNRSLVHDNHITNRLVTGCLHPRSDLLVTVNGPRFGTRQVQLRNFYRQLCRHNFTNERVRVVRACGSCALDCRGIHSTLRHAPSVRNVCVTGRDISNYMRTIHSVRGAKRIRVIDRSLASSAHHLLRDNRVSFAVTRGVRQRDCLTLLALHSCIRQRALPRSRVSAPVRVLYTRGV